MTSAPNRLRLLSGNNILPTAMLLALCLLVSACEILKPGVRDSGTVLQESTGEEVIEKLDTIYLPPLASDSTLDSTIFAGRPKLQIAVLLPFSLDRRSLDQMRQRDKNKRNLPRLSLDIYEGMLLAVDSLRAKGITLDLFVYDTKNDPSAIEEILRKPHMAEVDMIIGPLFTNNIKLVANFINGKDILMLSPLSPIENMVNNPNFIMANNGPTQQCKALASYIKASYPSKKVILVHQSADVKLVQLFQAFAEKEKLEVDLMLTDFKFEGINERLSLVDPNVVLVPSFNEIFVNSAASKLSSLADSLEIHTYGMTDWQRYESISFDYLTNIDFHFVADYWVSRETNFSRRFEQIHDNRFSVPPSIFAYKGYDLLYYFASMMDAYPGKLSEHMVKDADIGLTNNPYLFSPKLDANDRPTFYSNSMVHIIRYADNKQEKAN